MDPDLKRVRRLLRSESCPPQVIQRVRQVIAEERRQVLYRRLAFATAIVIAVLATLASVKINQDRKLAVARQESQRIVSEASLSLAYIGQRLTDTGSDTGVKILKGTLPGLIRGFRTASKAIIPKPTDQPNNPPSNSHD